jgi:uncharacterized protein (DUF1697 family)
MSRYAAFLRGINVGGHRVKNSELRALFEAMGLADVDTFRASGNVIFSADGEPTSDLGERIEAGLEQSLGYGVATFLRTAGEFHEIAHAEPFAAEHVEASAGRLQVAMLDAPPATSVRNEVLSLASDDDRLAFGARELYWLPSGGMLESALELKLIEQLLGPMTLRTKNTIEQIATRHFS